MASPVYKAFADRLPLQGSEQVLDFGCGIGTVAYYAAKRVPHGHITCLDISKRWLDVCRKRLRGCGNFTFLYTLTPTLQEDSYDVVYCHYVLHDISDCDLEKIIPVLEKSLKPGGSLVFREPLKHAEKLSLIKSLMKRCGLSLKDSRITDVPWMGNALESIYTK